MAASTPNPKVDAYISKSAAFAQPILDHLRGLIHKACPQAIEQIKWSRPFFLHNGEILCNISAFKEHCSFGFWGAQINNQLGKELTAAGIIHEGGMGSLGKITTLKDLPPDKQMLAYIRRAAELIDNGSGDNRVTVQRRVVKAPKPELEVPEEFATALRKNKAANTVFEAFSPSCKREYIGWIGEAKRDETRDHRIAQAIAWIAEGKQRNWKYQNC